MARSLLRLLSSFLKRQQSQERERISNAGERTQLARSFDANIRYLQSLLGDNPDIIYRTFTIRGDEKIPTALVYVDGMTDTHVIDTQLLRTLMLQAVEADRAIRLTRKTALQVAKESLVTVAAVHECADWDQLLLEVLSGSALLFFDDTPKALIVNVRSWHQRTVEAPATQSIIRGPRDGFSETLRTNMVLVRRRLRDAKLKFIHMQLGRRSQTDVVVAYIEDIASPAIVDEVMNRLKTIDIDGILESGQIEQLIEDNWLTVFPTIQETERPDQVVGALLGGRVAIMTDNTPFALLVPATFPMLLASPEDMYFRWPIATFLRILRYGTALLSLILPSLYVALTSFHLGMLPTNLALSLAATREAVSFPAFLEAFVMEIILEVLREAGLRLPSPIGQTIGIVGAIIVGDAAVQANLVSPIMVVVVAATAIASFAIPTYGFASALRLLRFALLVAAATAGLFGVMMGLLAILAHMSIIKSFGVPYLAPLAPFSPSDQGDVWMRWPLVSLKRRPRFLKPGDDVALEDDRQLDVPSEGERM